MADKNKDGKLDVAEYVVFSKMHAADTKDRIGEALRYTDEELKEHFIYLNRLTPEAHGITAKDLLIANQIYLDLVAKDFENSF